MKLRELKQGQFFTLKPVEAPKDSQVFIRQEYDRSIKRYWVQRFSDASSGRYISGDKEVFTDFVF